MRKFASEHPYLSQFLLSCAITGVVLIQYVISNIATSGSKSGDVVAQALLLLIPGIIALALLFVYPVVILGFQVVILLRALRWRAPQPHRPVYDSFVLALLSVLTVLYLGFVKETQFQAGWHEVLRNRELHSPISPGYYPVFIVLFILCAASFYTLWMEPVNEIPPLRAVFAIAIIYISAIYTAVWTAQVFVYENPFDLYLLVPVVVYLLIVARTITIVVKSYVADPQRDMKIQARPLLAKLSYLLQSARTWPIAAFLLVLPILGVVLGVLLLFGQGPHALIRAFTETSDWNLSQHVSPPNVFYDEHYLCTVAACGHETIVKPIRAGVRHGHTVVVNRQLQIANSFEQVISESLPRLHKAIRRLYDRYGFDLAKRVKSKWAADLVWVLMKPLEWFFLLVIYLFVPHPEDLIAMQYTGRKYSSISDLNNRI